MDSMYIPPPTMVTVSTKGQIVIPKEFRLAAGLDTGIKVVLYFHKDGSLELRPIKHSVLELFGSAKPYIKRHTLSSSKMEKDIMQQVMKEDDQTKSK